jgi:hypothetical protein
LALRALRLQLEHLRLLVHLRTSSIDNETAESHPHGDDGDHPSHGEVVAVRKAALGSNQCEFAGVVAGAWLIASGCALDGGS